MGQFTSQASMKESLGITAKNNACLKEGQVLLSQSHH
jgi:hypothetical protein